MSDKQVKLFALSTCGWCRKTVNWLNENGVQYDLHYVDQASAAEKEQLLADMAQYNPRKSFPTVVIDGGSCVIVGFKPDEMEEKLL